MPEDEIRTVANLEIHKKEGYVVVSVNPKIYSLDIVYSAAYVMMDKAFAVIDGNPEEEVFVELKGRSDASDLESLGRDFNNELINYAVFKIQSEREAATKEMIVQKALMSSRDADDDCDCDAQDDLEDEGQDTEFQDEKEIEDYLEDPLGIAKPWEEVHKNENP